MFFRSPVNVFFDNLSTPALTGKAWAIVSNVCTVTSVAHNMLAGSIVTVANGGTITAGDYVLTSVTADTFSFAFTAGDSTGTLDYTAVVYYDAATNGSKQTSKPVAGDTIYVLKSKCTQQADEACHRVVCVGGEYDQSTYALDMTGPVIVNNQTSKFTIGASTGRGLTCKTIHFHGAGYAGTPSNNYLRIGDIQDNGSGKARYSTGFQDFGAAYKATHGFVVGDLVNVAGTTYHNGDQTVTAIIDDWTFDTDKTYTGGGVNIHGNISSTHSNGKNGTVSGASDLGGGKTRFTTSATHSIILGANIFLSGITPTAYNGYYVVTNVPDNTHFDVVKTYTTAITVSGTYVAGPMRNWATGVNLAISASASASGGTKTQFTTATNTLVAGNYVTISGFGGALEVYNGSFPCESPDSTHFTINVPFVADGTGVFASKGAVINNSGDYVFMLNSITGNTTLSGLPSGQYKQTASAMWRNTVGSSSFFALHQPIGVIIYTYGGVECKLCELNSNVVYMNGIVHTEIVPGSTSSFHMRISTTTACALVLGTSFDIIGASTRNATLYFEYGVNAIYKKLSTGFSYLGTLNFSNATSSNVGMVPLWDFGRANIVFGAINSSRDRYFGDGNPGEIICGLISFTGGAGFTTTIKNGITNPNIRCTGINMAPTAGSLVWEKGTGLLTIEGATNDTFNPNTQSLESVVVNAAGGIKTLGSAFTTVDLTLTAGELSSDGYIITGTGAFVGGSAGKLSSSNTAGVVAPAGTLKGFSSFTYQDGFTIEAQGDTDWDGLLMPNSANINYRVNGTGKTFQINTSYSVKSFVGIAGTFRSGTDGRQRDFLVALRAISPGIASIKDINFGALNMCGGKSCVNLGNNKGFVFNDVAIPEAIA